MAEQRAFTSYFGGLGILPRNSAAAVKAVLISIVGVTAVVLLLDGLLFRRALPADYVAIYTGPLLPRTFVACLGAALEEVKFRFLLMSAIVFLLGLWRRPVPPWGFVAAILLSQFVNVGALVIAYPFWGTLRFWLVGSVWGVLYLRHGWLAALLAHGTIHLLLDPLLLWTLTQTG
jgi:hypothetical protein